MTQETWRGSHPVARVVGLIGALTTDIRTPDVRRRALVEGLAKLVRSDFTHWAWGRGNPPHSPIVPVAVISVGSNAALQRRWHALALSPLMDREIRLPIAPYVRPQAVRTRREVIPDKKWKSSLARKAIGDCIGMDEWMIAVRYCGPDTWCNFWLSRRRGRPPFSDQDRQIVELVLSHVALLHSVETDRDLPADMTSGLTHRQRTVLLLLVDGQSRKLIADSLKISQNTVNEHVKSLFRHFNVRSSTALAAKFLRGRLAMTPQNW